MVSRLLQGIRDAVAQGEYDVTVHAVEEMAEDGLDILDVECAIANGEITNTETDDPRGARYTIVGKAVDDQTFVGVAGRFKETGVFLVIPVYLTTD